VVTHTWSVGVIAHYGDSPHRYGFWSAHSFVDLRSVASCTFHFEQSHRRRSSMDSFARTPVGREFFRRLWLASDCRLCAEFQLTSSCFVDVVISDAFRHVVIDFCRSRGIFFSTVGVDSISRSLEHPNSFHTIGRDGGLEERCVAMHSMRSIIYSIDSLFFLRRGSSLFRVRKSGDDVAWRESVIPLLSSCDCFRDIFRHSRFAEFIRSLAFNAHGPGAAAAGRVEVSMLYFMSSFSCEDEVDQLAALDLFHRKDVSSMALLELPMSQWRDPCHGSAAYVYRLCFDSSPDSDSDSFALVSPVFRFLRDCFRSGPLYDRSILDDYGRPLSA